jgi:hypothetical protein
MASRFHSLRFCLTLSCALLLGGCASQQSKQAVGAPFSTLDFRALREKEMQMTWIGQPFEDLIHVFGTPTMIMNIPAYRPWKVSAVVYEGLDLDSNCIDAFTVVHSGTPVVDDYFCR